MRDLSIIIVNWNTREMTLRCLRSIQNDCASLSCEILLIDNASTDGSLEAIMGAFPEVVTIANQAKRFSNSWRESQTVRIGHGT